MKFLWSTLMVKDMQKSISFYRDILGLKVTRSFKPHEGLEITFLGEGETQIELICDDDKKDSNMGSDISLGFQTDSVEKMRELLKDKNVTMCSDIISPNPHIKYFFALDPNGLRIQFVETL